MRKLETSIFKSDVLRGLMKEEKQLFSKYLYDEIGCNLFQEIMNLDEYYLTRTELAIFEAYKDDIFHAVGENEKFRLIELGAGDAIKTKVLLKTFLKRGAEFIYSPIDISIHNIETLSNSLSREMPNLKVEAFQGDYFEVLEKISGNAEKQLVLFLGSNIGNFDNKHISSFLQQLKSFFKKGDQFLLGVDLKKDPNIILPAYNDAKGVTRAFNLNLLHRINHEINGNFVIDNFEHYPCYDPGTGECRSYLISKVAHTVEVANQLIKFRKWEPILIEVSKKYDKDELARLANKFKFNLKATFCDSNNWFTNMIWVNT